MRRRKTKQRFWPVGGFFSCIVMLLSVGIITAQDDLPRLELDEPLTVELVAEAPVWLAYNAEAGEVVTITARSLDSDPPIDTVLDVWTPEGEQFVYRDDRHTVDETGETVIQTDAVISNLLLPETGIYTIIVDSFNGVSEGTVEVMLTRGDRFNAEVSEGTDGLTITAYLPEDTLYTYAFDVQAGDTLTLTVRDTSGTLDPTLTLLDETGEVIAFNDDHAGRDLSLNLLDARIEGVGITTDAQLTLIVRDFNGAAGNFTVTVETFPVPG